MTDRILLIVAAIGLVPIALSYGAMPSSSLGWLLGIEVETVNLSHVFRAVMGLYLVNAAFWIAGAFLPELRKPALWVLVLFMGGLAAGRALSLVLDGMPSPILVLYLVLELGLAVAGIIALRRPVAA
ncbi:uncharacterized protein DUF4345 [Aliiruegeria haliotis]|uniref:Uncharacterized protein DUF4345 n=1 Tax=Aliiruegeria haliotis TaxID=1280846 RepID=A0A2T0RJZ0_9RHOB|nr:DUF4345 domain-containing protein [Aliiruegeria haliotis]PRY21451.1 uncharacterized protein DUF4345 [Aliiruegeria haliotis]